MNQFKNISTKIREIGLHRLWEENAENGLTSLYLAYTPDTQKLTIFGTFVDDCEPYQEQVGEYTCTPDVIGALFAGIINDPFFTKGNSEKPANIAVEYGAFR